VRVMSVWPGGWVDLPEMVDRAEGLAEMVDRAPAMVITSGKTRGDGKIDPRARWKPEWWQAYLESKGKGRGNG
jgi:hypothetical protein